MLFRNIREQTIDKRTGEPLIGITFTGLISLVYLVFCLIQLIYLFGGLGTLPDNYTYARYAREGFFQLVFVCIINLALVLICNKRFRSSKVLKGILVFLSLCTYVMIASSAYRMVLYIKAYHLTFLRILVLWGLVVIFLLISGTLALIFRESFPMVKYCVITVTVMYLGFSFSHPDYWIARYNLSHVSIADTENENVRTYSDFYYLENLSMDAAPVIFQMAENSGQDYAAIFSSDWFYRYSARLVLKSWSWKAQDVLPKSQSVRKFNFSRWAAFKDYTNYYQNIGNEDFKANINRLVM